MKTIIATAALLVASLTLKASTRTPQAEGTASDSTVVAEAVLAPLSLTPKQARALLAASFQPFGDGDVVYKTYPQATGIKTVVSSKKDDYSYELHLAYDNIKYIEFEDGNRLSLFAKHKAHIVTKFRQEAATGKPHAWGELVILLKPEANPTHIERALEVLSLAD
jgi:hypothetical protein